MSANTGERENEAGTSAPQRIVVVATEPLSDPELLDELRRSIPANGSKVIVVAPAVERSAFHHALGDVDTATREARRNLDDSLAALHGRGIAALGEVGDSDPVVAAADVLRQYPADEVLIVAHSDDQARWFENGLFERAREALYPPIRLIAVRHEPDGEAHVTQTKRSKAGHDPPADVHHEVEISDNLPRFNRGDLVGMVLGVVGTIVAILLAATGPSPSSAAGAAQILIAMAIALVNMAHVVAILLLESVHYRGGWQRFFRNLSLVGTPAAVVANLLLTLFG